MSHKINTSTRRNREEGNQADLSIGAVIGLVGASAVAATAGCEVGSRASSYCCDKISRWWHSDDSESSSRRKEKDENPR